MVGPSIMPRLVETAEMGMWLVPFGPSEVATMVWVPEGAPDPRELLLGLAKERLALESRSRPESPPARNRHERRRAARRSFFEG